MKGPIPSATVARLPRYLRCLTDMANTGVRCSSDTLAAAAGVTSAQVRKDLSYLGSYGTRGVGYDVDELRAEIRDALGLTRTYPVAIVGAGNLGTALSAYRGFDAWGFDIVAIFDVDRDKIGSTVDGLTIEPYARLASIVADRGVEIAIIATPAPVAQDVANRLVDAGVTSILNLAPAILKLPDGVHTRRVDLSTELGILAFHRQRTVDG